MAALEGVQMLLLDTFNCSYEFTPQILKDMKKGHTMLKYNYTLSASVQNIICSNIQKCQNI